MKPATQPATDQPPGPTTCPLENRLHILESQIAELLKAATAEKSSRDVDYLDVTPGVATNGVLSYSEALDGSKRPQQKDYAADRDSVMDSDFWPENVGCREFYFKRKVEQTIVK